MSLKVSIITVCYNSATTIEDTIRSVVSQTYSNVEYLVIDGGSSDATLEIVDSYRNGISQLVSEADNGMYDAINKGIGMATGEVIAILNSDDVYMDSKVVEDMVDLFEKKKMDAAYADLEYVDRKLLDKTIRYWKSGPYKEGMFLKGWMPPHPTFFVKKDVYVKFGLFDLQFKSAADYEIMLRFVHKNKVKLGYLPRTIVKMRMGGMSNASIRNRIRANREDRRAWEVNGIEPKKYTLLLKPLSKIIQYFNKVS